MSVHELALQRSKYKHLSDDEWRWFLQQVEGRERTADKLPAFAAIEDWWYPVRLSCEQCSSELTAKYKASILPSLQKGFGGRFVDLTGGYGVDTYFMSEHFAHTDYVEQNEELCRIAKHNFSLPTPSRPKGKEIYVHHSTAEDFLIQGKYDLIFLDPARRDSHGGKVFRLEECTPDVVELLPTLLSHLTPDGHIMLKLSPMLDITQAVKELTFVPCTSSPCTLTWDVHVMAVKNEVKEVLLLSKCSNEPINGKMVNAITAIDLSKKEQAFVFTREEEQECPSSFPLSSFTFLYEPNAAILKAGAYKLVAQRFGLTKLDVNTHLYASDTLIAHFPGRIWRIKEPTPSLPKGKEVNQANVLTRNYPLTPEALKKKLHLRDGGTAYVIGCRVAGKPTLFYAERVEDIH